MIPDHILADLPPNVRRAIEHLSGTQDELNDRLNAAEQTGAGSGQDFPRRRHVPIDPRAPREPEGEPI